jgi:lanosterol synthase
MCLVCAQPTDAPTLPVPVNALEAARKTFDYFARTQTADGHWACDYGGPLFLLPGTGCLRLSVNLS